MSFILLAINGDGCGGLLVLPIVLFVLFLMLTRSGVGIDIEATELFAFESTSAIDPVLCETSFNAVIFDVDNDDDDVVVVILLLNFYKTV